MPCHGCRAAARLTALHAATAETGTDPSRLRITLTQKQGVLEAAKQQQRDKQQQAEMHRLGLGSLMLHQTPEGNHYTW